MPTIITVMKQYLKQPINLVIFILFLVSTLCPIASFGGDVIAYVTGHHHGFHEPWPTIQVFLNLAFPIMLVVMIIDVVIYLTTKKEKKKEA